MTDLAELISFVVPVISLCFIAFLTSIQVYIRIRQNFPIKVNCWFCNVNSKVPYNQYNSWTCPNCDQYNGFDKHGDYNCDIPAQRSSQLNKRWRTGTAVEQRLNNSSSSAKSTVTASRYGNGLCVICNRNQELKMQQLATFEPKNGDNFDEEIEHYRKKLEKSYQLCYRCQKVVKRTLNRVKNNVLGSKLAQIGTKGLTTFDLHKTKANKNAVSRERHIFSTVCWLALIVLSALNLVNSGDAVNITKPQLDIYFPATVSHSILVIISYISAFKLVFLEYLTAFDPFTSYFLPNNFVVGRLTDVFGPIRDFNLMIDFTAILLSIFLIFSNNFKRNSSILVLLLWSIKMLLPKIEGMVDSLVGDFIKIAIASLICIVSVVNNKPSEKINTNKNHSGNGSFHRIYSDCDEDLSENSDNETSISHSSNLTQGNRMNKSSQLNNSFNSTKSLSPTPLTSDSLRSHNISSSGCVLNRSFGSEYSHLTSQYSKSKPENIFTQRLGSNQTYFFPNKCTSMTSLNSPFRIPDDCQNGLNGLNISGKNYPSNRTITCSSPTPSLISVKHRSQLLTPSRLNVSMHASPTSPVTQTSWVAGGFFVKNGTPTSPQKRQPSIVGNGNSVLPPILSRTSSQSSGFESQASSVHNGNGNGSRESSITGDGDHASVFSEPSHFPDSVSQLGHTYSNSIVGQTATIQRPQPIFPHLADTQSTFICPPLSQRNKSLTNCSMFDLGGHRSNATTLYQQPSIYHQFGTQRGHFSSANSGFSSGSMDNLYAANRVAHNNEPTSFRRGSLIKTFNESNCSLQS